MTSVLLKKALRERGYRENDHNDMFFIHPVKDGLNIYNGMEFIKLTEEQILRDKDFNLVNKIAGTLYNDDIQEFQKISSVSKGGQHYTYKTVKTGNIHYKNEKEKACCPGSCVVL